MTDLPLFPNLIVTLTAIGSAVYAHTGCKADRSDWQGLSDHLTQTADGAAQRGGALGLAEMARLAGAYHDLVATSRFKASSTAAAKKKGDQPALDTSKN